MCFLVGALPEVQNPFLSSFLIKWEACQLVRVVLLVLNIGKQFVHLKLSIDMAGDNVSGLALLKFV